MLVIETLNAKFLISWKVTHASACDYMVNYFENMLQRCNQNSAFHAWAGHNSALTILLFMIELTIIQLWLFCFSLFSFDIIWESENWKKHKFLTWLRPLHLEEFTFDGFRWVESCNSVPKKQQSQEVNHCSCFHLLFGICTDENIFDNSY